MKLTFLMGNMGAAAAFSFVGQQSATYEEMAQKKNNYTKQLYTLMNLDSDIQ